MRRRTRMMLALGFIAIFVAALLATLVAYLVVRQQADSVPAIPLERPLAAMGLVVTPAHGQSPGPFVVDTVAIDGEHTYVAYHSHVPQRAATLQAPTFSLSATPGGWLNSGASGVCRAPRGALLPWLLSWFPAPLPVSQPCLYIAGSPPPTARTLLLRVTILTFPLPGARRSSPPRAGRQYTLRVPLNPRALRRLHHAALSATVSRGDVAVSITDLYRWPTGNYLAGAISGPPGTLPTAPHTYLNGREIRSLGAFGGCTSGVCPAWWALPALRHGARVTLSIPRVDLGSGQGSFGPLRTTFTLP